MIVRGFDTIRCARSEYSQYRR